VLSFTLGTYMHGRSVGGRSTKPATKLELLDEAYGSIISVSV
jgi:hypothetical protein